MLFLFSSCSFRQDRNIEMVKHCQSCSDMFSFCRTKHETGRPRFVATRHVRQHFIIMVFQGVLLSYLMMQITFSVLSDDNSAARMIQYLVEELQFSHASYPPSVLTAGCDEARIAHSVICLGSWVFQTEEKNYNRLLTTVPGYSLTKLPSTNLFNT